LNRRLGDPGERHKRALFFGVLFLAGDRESSDPSGAYSYDNNYQTVSDLGNINIREEDSGADGAEEHGLYEHPEDCQFVFRLVIAPHAETHEAVEDDEDELGLGEADHVAQNRCTDGKEKRHTELPPLGRGCWPAVKDFHGPTYK